MGSSERQESRAGACGRTARRERHRASVSRAGDGGDCRRGKTSRHEPLTRRRGRGARRPPHGRRCLAPALLRLIERFARGYVGLSVGAIVGDAEAAVGVGRTSGWCLPWPGHKLPDRVGHEGVHVAFAGGCGSARRPGARSTSRLDLPGDGHPSRGPADHPGGSGNAHFRASSIATGDVASGAAKTEGSLLRPNT